MFRKLMAVGLLAAASVAHAQQANVQIGGRISQYVTNYSNGGAPTVKQIDSNTSNIFFRGSEDLGGGLRANFVIDTSIAVDNPATGNDTKLGDRQSTVGLSNKFGSVDIGRKDNAMFQYGKSHFDAFAVLPLFSTANKIHNYRGNRIGNGVFLEAKPVTGVTVGYQNGFSESATQQDTQVYYGVVNPIKDLHVGAFHYTTNGTDKSTMLSAAYVLPTSTRVFANYGKDRVTNVDYNSWSVGAVHPVTARVDFKASYGKKDVVDQTAYTTGFAYNFSKRTAVDVAFQKITALSSANEEQRYGVGLTHRF